MFHPIYKKISINLLRIRRNKGLSQEDLANKAGYSQTWISQIEAGMTKRPNIEQLCKLSEALECSLYELIPNQNNEDTNE